MNNIVIAKAFVKATKLLNLKSTEITNLTGICPEDWSLISNQEQISNFDTIDTEFALLLIRIFCSLDGIFGGNHERAHEWLRSYNHHLNGIPSDLIQKKQDIVKVVTYLETMHHLT